MGTTVIGREKGFTWAISLGDSYRLEGDPSADLYTEAYVCHLSVSFFKRIV